MPAVAAALPPHSLFRGIAGDVHSPAAPPPLALLWSEFTRAAGEFGSLAAAWPWLNTAPRGDGHPVLVVPGFGASDTLTAPLRAFLRGRGFDVHAWQGGRNFGRWEAVAEHLLPRIERLSRVAGGKRVSLVGSSMGGLFARAAAHVRPDLVRCVVTLGSAARGPATANHLWPWYEMLTGESREALVVPAPDVPSTSVFSRVDGMGDWRTCLQAPREGAENIGICSSHHGLVHHPLALYLVADRLAQAEGEWQPFEPPAGTSLLYRAETLDAEAGEPQAAARTAPAVH